MWIKLRLAPMCPYIGSISLAFVGAPNVKVQLLPYNRVRVMRIPILQVSTAPSTSPEEACFVGLPGNCHVQILTALDGETLIPLWLAGLPHKAVHSGPARAHCPS